MNFISVYLNHILAVGYFPDDSQPIKAIPFPQLPQLVSIERILLIILLVLLLLPLLKKQKDSIQERIRIRILKLASVICAVLLLILFYRILTGHF